MKQYITPKIKSIELNAEQAILQICQLGGIYIYIQPYVSSRCAIIGSTGVAGSRYTCPVSVKGRSTTGPYETINQTSQQPGS